MNHLLRLLIAAAALSPALVGCDAGQDPVGGNTVSGGAGGTNAGGDASGGAPQGGTQSTGTVMFTGGNGGGGNGEGGMAGGPPINPCGTECGDTELCTSINKGIDDDCDGEVDEGCACKDGQASSCFKGDPSYLDDPGCNPGTMHCTELGLWGPCEGGNHATDMCFNADPLGCHPISVVPFGTADLTTGPGNFNDDPNIDTHLYEVECPMGVDPCPAPNGTDYTPLQSGEYTVTYTKTIDGVPEVCTFPLYVGARGLRVELSISPANIDLDLHMKKPMSVQPWITGGAEQDCGYGNCKANSFVFGSANAPHWFPDANAIPDPVNWYEAPNFDENGCYFAPPPQGEDWSDYANGCHNPRLDVDNVGCNLSITDPTVQGFCAPENINVDFPPKDQWIRIGVHHYAGAVPGGVQPNVKIFCDGALAADLGTNGFYTPSVPFQWGAGDSKKQWLVADVLFREDECVKECIVEPLYLAPSSEKLPIELTEAQAANPMSGYGPPYPPVP